MLKLLLNLAILFLAATFVRRLVRGWLGSKSGASRTRTTRQQRREGDIGQGQKIEEADYEDLP
ncbi:MAG TPA: hypothetical protein VKA86_12100 [Candidatus Krumholzibacteria bacterium]|nr:hypothetical protein [Candidatus Krumholzibacteria bacterium]